MSKLDWKRKETKIGRERERERDKCRESIKYRRRASEEMEDPTLKRMTKDNETNGGWRNGGEDFENVEKVKENELEEK